jgi:hypothetical protein
LFLGQYSKDVTQYHLVLILLAVAVAAAGAIVVAMMF